MRQSHNIRAVLLALLSALLTSAATLRAEGRLDVVGSDIVDFGIYPSWERRVAHYALQNTGKSDLQILDVRNTCGCATVGFKTTTLTPGETTTLDVAVLPNSISGKYRKATYIRSSDPTKRLMRLSVKGNAEPLVDIKPHSFISAGILETNQGKTWTFALNPNRWPITFAPVQTTSSVPVEVEFTAPTNATPGALIVKMPPQASPTRLSVTAKTVATYRTNNIPLIFDITGLIGKHLVAIPSRLTIPNANTPFRGRIRLHTVAPAHQSKRIQPENLVLPDLPGVSFGTPTRDHTGKGLWVDLKFSPAFASRVHAEATIPITFHVQGAASATVTCKSPSAPAP